MWTARADIEQLLEQWSALAYFERRRDISEDDRDAPWLYVWLRSRTGTSLSADSRSPPGTLEAWRETERP
jgi:hypothetical protein